MYTLAIVEDEILINNKIKIFVEKSENIVVVGQYINGLEAITAFEQNGYPNIIISDINMPNFSGIQLSKAVKSANPATQIILVSGYAEFKYAQSALQIGVNFYILKPIKKVELMDAVENCMINFNKCNAYMPLTEDATRSGSEFNAIKHFAFSKNGANKGDRDSLPTRDKLSHQYYALFSIYCCLGFKSSYSALLETFNLNFEGGEFLYYNITGSFENSRCNLVICGDDVEGLDVFCASASNQIVDAYPDQIKIYYVIQNTENIGSMAEKNETSFMRRFIVDEDIFEYSKPEINRSVLKQIFSELYTRFITIIDNANEFSSSYFTGELIDIINKMFCAENLKKCGNQTIKMLFTEFFSNVQWALNSYSDEFSEIVPRVVLSGDVLEELDNNQQLMAFLKSAATNVFEQDSIKKGDTLAKQAMKLMAESYQNPEISLVAIAEKLYVSSSYLSRIFKEETGENFNHYFNQIKIEKAKQLLANTDREIVEIALDVGYNNQQYFSKVFKKTTQKTPMEYRNKHS